jgi:hydrogenase maturation protease
MNDVGRTWIVGIGSDFGDDRLGPVVVDRLVVRLPNTVVRRVRSPLDLLDHLEEIERLHLVDACRGGGARAGTIRRIDWPAPELATVRFSGTHDVGLVAALQLAERMQTLPQRVTIWSVEAADAVGPQNLLAPLSQPVAAAAETLADLIAAEVTNHPVAVTEPIHHA